MTTEIKSKRSSISIIYSFLITVVILLIAIMAGVPPVSRDALTHHLFIPKLYLQHGGIYEIPQISFSYYPMNLELLYLIPLYFKNDILPKFIHFTFALATTLMIFRYVKRKINTEFALLGSLFFLSIPIIVNLSGVVYVDLGLVCFLFGAMIYLFKWIENNFTISYLIISAVFCGLALGTKYNGLIGFFLLGLFVPFVYARYHAGNPHYAGKAIGYFGVYVLVALIVFSPWMIRNIIWTGNPVYPLYKSIFHSEESPNVAISEDETESYHDISQFRIRRDIYGEKGWEIALIPLRVFFQGRDNDPQYFDGRSSPFLLLLPIFAFWGIHSNSRQIKTEKFILVGFSVLFLLFACAQTVIRIRYFTPIFPPLVILAIFGLRNIQKDILYPKLRIPVTVKRIIFFSIIFVMLGINAQYIIKRFSYVQPLDYLTGRINRDGYIRKFLPEYKTIQFANKNLTKNDRILGVYIGNRGYYSDIDIEFSLDLLQKLAAKAATPKDIIDGLHDRGISYLLINYEMFSYWASKYSLHEKQMLKNFFKIYTVQAFSKDGTGLLRLKESS